MTIGNVELIDKRNHRSVPISPGGTLSDYVPFYFTPFSPMMLNIKTGYGGVQRRSNEEIVIMVTSLPHLAERNIPFLFTDRHAYLKNANYFSSLPDLKHIDWPRLQAKDFSRSADEPDKMERYQAEALVHKGLPASALLGIACYDPSVADRIKRMISDERLKIDVKSLPGWYF